MKKKSVIINVIITIVIWLLVFVIKWQYEQGNIDITIKTATIIGVSINLLCIISMIFIEKSVTSPYVLFQTLSIPFLYGQLICSELLNINLEVGNLRSIVTNESLIKTCFLIAYCQLALHMGNLIYKIVRVRKKSNKDIADSQDNEDMKLNTMKKVGMILLFISIVPAFYQFFLNFKMTSMYGYAGKFMNVTYGLDSIVTKIVPFFQISIFMLMVAYKKNPKISRGILIFLIAFYGIQILFGNRGLPIIAVITSIWLYNFNYSYISDYECSKGN